MRAMALFGLFADGSDEQWFAVNCAMLAWAAIELTVHGADVAAVVGERVALSEPMRSYLQARAGELRGRQGGRGPLAAQLLNGLDSEVLTRLDAALAPH